MAVGSVGEVLLDKYVVERELGRGGMGFVVAARHIELGELVAIKMVLPQYATNEEVVRRFLREAKAAARIANDHVVRVSDVGRLPSGEPYMVMEMLQGDDLEQYLMGHGALPVSDVVDFIMQALEAVAEAHAAGIIHRDLKPANLFVTRRRNGTPCVKVLDFGISKLTGSQATIGPAMTRSQGLLGSPLYMSPEQLESASSVDGRADIWSLGIIAYQLLVNQFPFNGDSLPQLVLRVMNSKPESLHALRPEIPVELEAVVNRCIEKKREDRFPDVQALAQALAPFGSAASQASHLTRGGAGTVLPPSNPPPASGVVRPDAAATTMPAAKTLSPFGQTVPAPGSASKAKWMIGAVVLVVLGVGSAITLTQYHSAPAVAAQSGDKPSDLRAAAAPIPPPPVATESAAPIAPAAIAVAAVDAGIAASPGAPKGKPASVPAKASAPAAPTVAPNCTPPYTFDANGNKVFKPECI